MQTWTSRLAALCCVPLAPLVRADVPPARMCWLLAKELPAKNGSFNSELVVCKQDVQRRGGLELMRRHWHSLSFLFMVSQGPETHAPDFCWPVGGGVGKAGEKMTKGVCRLWYLFPMGLVSC